MDPWNQWTYLFFALTALCLGLAWAAPAVLGRGARAAGPDIALVPAAALYVIAFGIYMPSWALEQGGTVASGRTIVTGDSLLANASQPQAFWLSVAIVAVAAVLTLVAPRAARYLASVSLLVFGFWEAWVITYLHLDIILSGSRYWYDFLLGASNRPAVGVSVLADRGLADAVRAIAIDCAIPVKTAISLDGRPPAPVESAVYFAVAEILNNVTRHAEASSAIIQAEHHRGMLRVEVTDDGIGGADSSQGTGLSGIEGRLAVFDGILAVVSPAGGPTTVVIEVPCALSSPKMSIC